MDCYNAKWEDIPENEMAKRAVEIAAAGGFSLALISHDNTIANALTAHARELGAGDVRVVPAEALDANIEALDADIVAVVFPPSHDTRGYEKFSAVRVRIERAKLANTRCQLSDMAWRLLGMARRDWGFGLEKAQRTIRISHTIAMLSESEIIDAEHVAEALVYRGGRPRADQRGAVALDAAGADLAITVQRIA